ncbi:MAG: hypothetical protein NTW75_09130 [Planctomycetales bacterium]|nr:hypothetical protein [Planctomycetales bacterium]
MRRIPLKTWTAGILSLLCSWTVSAADRYPTIDGIFKPMDDQAFVEQVVCESTSSVANTQSCDTTCSHSMFRPFVGVEATFLKANVEGSGSNVNINGSNYGSPAEGFYAAPRIWGGFGIGSTPLFVQFQYWQLGGNDVSNPATATPSGATIGSSSGTLDLKAFDFELGNVFCLDAINSTLTVTYGGRQTQWGQSSSAVGGEFGSNFLDYSTAAGSSVSEFKGLGLTSSYLLSHQVGCSNWSVFAMNRNSWIWGNQSSSSVTSAQTAIADGSGMSSAGAFNMAFGDNTSSTMWISEIQAGTQWQKQLECMNATAFFRIALEFQYWDTNSDSSASTFSAVGTESTNAYATADGGPLDMTLFGLALSTGLSF